MWVARDRITALQQHQMLLLHAWHFFLHRPSQGERMHAGFYCASIPFEQTQPFPRLKLKGEAGLPGLLAFPPDCRSRHNRALSLFRGCRGVGEKQKLFFVFHTPRTFPERTTIGTGVPPGASEIFLRALLAPGVFCPNDPIGELNIFAPEALGNDRKVSHVETV